MKRIYKACIKALLLCICLGLCGCSSGNDVDENGNTAQVEKDIDLYDLIVEKASQLAEEHTFEEGDIYVDSILYGYYSQTEEQEMLALCKYRNSAHVAGLDRTLAIILSPKSMEVIAYKNFGADEVTLKRLPTEGESKILFLGRSSSTGLTSQYVELYAIQENEWVMIPLEGIQLRGDELCYITDDNSLIVVPRENGAYPNQMFVLWDEQVMYSWDEHTEQFMNIQLSTLD